MRPIFISRDGVVNVRRPGGVTHRTQLELIPGSIKAIGTLTKQGFTVVLLSHQPGLSRGLFDLDELDAIHATITDAVEQLGGTIAAIFYCPHDEGDRCHCRPPATGLVDVIEIELDCDAKDVFYLCDNEVETVMAAQKSCIPILCQHGVTLESSLNTILQETNSNR